MECCTTLTPCLCVCVDISSRGRRLGSADSGGISEGWLERGCAELGGVWEQKAVGGSLGASGDAGEQHGQGKLCHRQGVGSRVV